MREFVKTLAYIQTNEYGPFLNRLRQQQTPCGLYFGVKRNDEFVTNIVQSVRGIGINITYLLFIGTKNVAPVPSTIQGIRTADLHDLQSCASDMKHILSAAGIWEISLFTLAEKYGIDTVQLESSASSESKIRLLYEHLPEIYDAYALLNDDESRQAFRGFLSYRFTCRLNDFVFAPEAQYFLAGFVPETGDIVIDGGAYDGGTARDFASLGTNVYAFEMDRNNFPVCLQTAKKYGFVAENLGLGECEKTVSYLSNETGSSLYFDGGSERAQLTDIDTYVCKKGLPRVDYIKLDVEGAELDTLKGAARTICKWKPKMALSAYHRPEDIYTLATFIKSLRPIRLMCMLILSAKARNDFLWSMVPICWQRQIVRPCCIVADLFMRKPKNVRRY